MSKHWIIFNRDKSKMFFGKGCTNKEELKMAIGVTEGRLHFKYLGVPLSVNYLKARDYSMLIDKCRERIE